MTSDSGSGGGSNVGLIIGIVVGILVVVAVVAVMVLVKTGKIGGPKSAAYREKHRAFGSVETP